MFAMALVFVLSWEGGYTNDPDDPGGPTNDGITQDEYDRHRQACGEPTRSVQDITQAEYTNIYADGYWSPCHCDAFPYAVALTLFDSAVNTGVEHAIKWLQGELGVEVDGDPGPNTLAAAQEYIAAHGATTLALGIIARRGQYYQEIVNDRPTLGKFLPGWNNRDAALKLAIV